MIALWGKDRRVHTAGAERRNSALSITSQREGDGCTIAYKWFCDIDYVAGWDFDDCCGGGARQFANRGELRKIRPARTRIEDGIVRYDRTI